MVEDIIIQHKVNHNSNLKVEHDVEDVDVVNQNFIVEVNYVGKGLVVQIIFVNDEDNLEEKVDYLN